MSRDSSTSEEKESFRELWEEFVLGKNSIEDVLTEEEFLRRGMTTCRRLTAGTRHDAEELFVDVCAKMSEMRGELKEKNRPVKELFFSRFRVIALNIRHSQISMEHHPRRLGPPDLSEGVLSGAVAKTRDEADAHGTPAEMLAEIAALPLEGETDEFSGRDHDSVLYPRK